MRKISIECDGIDPETGAAVFVVMGTGPYIAWNETAPAQFYVYGSPTMNEFTLWEVVERAGVQTLSDAQAAIGDVAKVAMRRAGWME